MALPKAKNRGGRPRKRKIKPGDRVPIGFRVTPQMKARLDAAASQSGRSQSQEIELRLERSFDRAGTLLGLLTATYGPQLAAMLSILGETLRMVVAHATSHLLTPSDSKPDDHYKALNAAYRGGDLGHPYVLGQVGDAIFAIMSALRPDVESLEAPDGIAPPTLEGNDIAAMFVEDLLSPPAQEKEYAAQIVALLGDLRLHSLLEGPAEEQSK